MPEREEIAFIEDSSPKRIWPGWVACLLAASALYAVTANRGAQWQDSGYFILRAVTGESVNPLGLAMTHPLHYWLSRFVLWLNFAAPAFAVTLISCVSAALAVANVFGCVAALTGNRMVAALVAASLGLASTFWQLATIAETYALSAALMSAQCWCVIALVKPTLDKENPAPEPDLSPQTQRRQRWLFFGTWLLNGVWVANHNQALLTIPMLLAVSLWAFRRGIISHRVLLLAIVLGVVGSLPFVGLVIEEGARSGDWGETIRSALFGHHFQNRVLNVSLSRHLSAIAGGFILLNFPNLFLPAAVAGLWMGWKHHRSSPLCRLLLWGLVIHALFAFRYPVSDQHYFFLPTYVFLSLFAGLGFQRWVTRRSEPRRRGEASDATRLDALPLRGRMVLTVAWLLVAATPILYAAAPAVLHRLDTLEFFNRNKPYRDDYRYLFVPWSVAERSAERMSREAVHMAGECGVIVVEDKMAEFAVRYQALHLGEDCVRVMEDLDAGTFEEAIRTGRSVVLVPADVNRVYTHPIRGSWRRQGDLYVLDVN